MALIPIDSGVPSPYLDANRSAERLERRPGAVATRSPAAEQADRRPETQADDTAEISQGAREMVDLHAAVRAGRATLDRLPDVRTESVERARERLATGFYESAAVVDEVAARLARVVDSMDAL
ncbi:MAG: hypothetical protein R6X25_08850 [Candidatus Krumholzibacteriia bacterium]